MRKGIFIPLAVWNLGELHPNERVLLAEVLNFEAQGKEKFAMKNYARLQGPKADLCATCKGYCEAACPYDVPVHGLLNLAHHTLTLT